MLVSCVVVILAPTTTLNIHFPPADHSQALNHQRSNKETPLHLAARHGHLEIAKLLIAKGAKVNERDENLSTPLILASQFNHYQVVEFLLQR